MSNYKVRWSADSPDDFPKEFEYGVWLEPYDGERLVYARYDPVTKTRPPPTKQPYRHTGVFSKHDNLSLVKREISTSVGGAGGTTTRSVRVYEKHGGDWIEIYHIAADTKLKQHELWAKGKAPTTPQATAEVDITDALASIASVLGRSQA